MTAPAEPVPNIVIHPGDVLVLDPDTAGDGTCSVRVHDRDEAAVAVLDCEVDPAAPDCWRVLAIRFVGTPQEAQP